MRRLLALVALLLAAPAPAAAQWSETPAVELGRSHPATCLRDAGPGHVSALAERGPRFGAALYAAGADGLRSVGEVLFGHGVVDCPVAAVAASGAAVVAAPMVNAPRGRSQRLDSPPPQRLRVAVRDPGGAFGAPLEVARTRGRPGWLEPSVAVAPDGSAVIAWIERYNVLERGGRGRVVIRVVTRAPGAPFGAPQTLLDQRHRLFASQSDVAAQIDGAGRATVAWARPASRRRPGTGGGTAAVEVATAAPGSRFGPPAVLARDVDSLSEVALTVTPDGRALLVHDGQAGVQVYERSPGAAAFGAATTFAAFEGVGGRPAVALAPDGSAVLAWRFGDAVDGVVRTGAGAWGKVAHLQHDPNDDLGGSFGVSLLPDEGPPVEHDDGGPHAAVAPGGQAVVGWLEESKPEGAPARAWAADASAGTFASARALGSALRDADAVRPTVGEGGAAVVWTDNGPLSARSRPLGVGRLHLAQPGRTPARPPAPRISVTARPQTLRYRDPLEVHVRCTAACDLRAVIAPRRLSGDVGRRKDGPTGASVGVGGRDDAGRVTLRLWSTSGNSIAPPGGGPVRVKVHATAPGGGRSSHAVVSVPVARRPPPPFFPPVDVRARRAGDDVIVTWRTDGPARGTPFLVFARRTRGRRPDLDLPTDWRYGRGRQHFRVRLRDASKARFVVVFGYRVEPPVRSRTVIVPLP